MAPNHSPYTQHAQVDAAPARNMSRQITNDGRNSLRQYLFGSRKRPQHLTWFRSIIKPEIYPLLFIVPAAVAAGVWFGIRELRLNPDVQVNKMERQKSIRHHDAKGERWVRSHKSISHAYPIVRHQE